MATLQELRVRIGFSRENWRRARKTEGFWFTELRRVRKGSGTGIKLKLFEVEVNWPDEEKSENCDDEGLDVAGFPFRLLRPSVEEAEKAFREFPR